MTKENNYLKVVYNAKDRPFTEYPDKLTHYLAERYELKEGNKILDLGCGRGEFLRGFMQCGLKGFGVDRGDSAKQICPEAEIIISDLEEALPYPDNYFDYVYSKSVIEHFYYPEKLVSEIYRILKPGGIVITMTPDWETVYKTFYEDCTHRTPFTRTSLRNIFLINGFDSVLCEKFRQLPFIWRYPLAWPLCSLIAFLTPKGLKKHSKLVRFSKEIMLLCSATKRISEL